MENDFRRSHPIVLIVGCGDIGQRVARREFDLGRGVVALARSGSTAERLARQGISIVRGDLDHPDSLEQFPGPAETLYYFAPPSPYGEGDSRLAALLMRLTVGPLPSRVVYISTSGVYGDCGGAWITEQTPLNPVTDRGRRRAAAEQTLRDFADETGVAQVVLRVPGIYGPGRLPVNRIRQAVPVVVENESPFSNRIHADDLAQACIAAARFGVAGQAYNVSDGHPTTMTDYFYRVADCLGLPRPPAISLAEARRVLSPGMLSFLEESKRLDNRRMLDELRVALRYPDLTRGLEASMTTDDNGLPPVQDGA